MYQKKRSEGERYLEKFLKSKSIKFEVEKVIEGLANDNSSSRRADFYLPNYKVFMEFEGQWNRDDKKQFYWDKKQAYKKNKIPCIYIYPENLGIIDYLFHERMLTVLKEHGMNKERMKYKIWRFITSKAQLLFWFVFFMLYLITEKQEFQPGSIDEQLYGFAAIMALVQFIRIIVNVRRIVIKEN